MVKRCPQITLHLRKPQHFLAGKGSKETEMSTPRERSTSEVDELTEDTKVMLSFGDSPSSNASTFFTPGASSNPGNVIPTPPAIGPTAKTLIFQETGMQVVT